MPQKTGSLPNKGQHSMHVRYPQSRISTPHPEKLPTSQCQAREPRWPLHLLAYTTEIQRVDALFGGAKWANCIPAPESLRIVDCGTAHAPPTRVPSSAPTEEQRLVSCPVKKCQNRFSTAVPHYYGSAEVTRTQPCRMTRI